MKKLVLALFFGFFLSIGAFAEMVSTDVLIKEDTSEILLRGGSSASVGGDTVDERLETAWFYGNRPIKTCYNLNPVFAVPAEQVHKTVEQALKDWQDYFSKKKVSSKVIDEKDRINTNFLFLGECKGDEDLVLHFGTGPIFGNTKDLKMAQKLSRPIAYVNKTHMSRDLRWSKGYIRFVSHAYYRVGQTSFPDWKRPGALKAFVVHELGHVLGFRHSDNTIMDESISRHVFFGERHHHDSHIDGERELVHCTNCSETFSLSGTRLISFFPQPKSNKSVVLHRLGKKFTLEIDGQKHPLKVQGANEIASFSVLKSNFAAGELAKQQVLNFFGFLEWKGKKLPFFLEYNTNVDGSDFVSIRSYDSGQIESSLFKRN